MSMKIAITGEKGFVGLHLVNYFKYILKYEVIELGRDYLFKLSEVDELDWLIHGAFLHRSSDPNEVLEVNKKLCTDTVECLKNKKVNIVFLSSIQEELDTPYGIAKRESKKILNEYCLSVDSEFVSYKLPNVFGKYAKPNRTSFIATFCYNLHNDIEIQYNENVVKLNYIDNVIEIIGSFKRQEVPFKEITVKEVYLKLKELKTKLSLNQFPRIDNELDLHLFQTFLDYKNYKI